MLNKSVEKKRGEGGGDETEEWRVYANAYKKDQKGKEKERQTDRRTGGQIKGG